MANSNNPFPTDEAVYANEQTYQLFSALRSVPSIAGASCQRLAGSLDQDDQDDEELRVTLAHSDQDRDTTLTSQRIVSCRNGSFFTAHSSIPLPGDVSILSTSPSGECTVMVKPGTPQTIEIWTPCRKKSHLEIPEDLHGSVLNDGFFGYGFTWSPCGRYAAYSAERGKTSQGQDDGAQNPPSAPKQAPLTKPVKKDSKLKEDWGEKHTGKRPPTVFVLDTEACRAWAIEGQAEDTSYGQPQWTPEEGLLMVAWPHQQEVFPHLKFRLGLVYCFNRTCGFVLCNAPTAAPAAEPNTKQPPLTAITFEPALQSAMEARFSPNGASLVFVSHEQACVRKTHSAGASLHVSRWTDIAQRAAGEAGVAVPQTTIVPTVDAPADVDAFPGLYPAGLAATMIPARPWLGDSSLLVNTLWGSSVAVTAVSLTGQVTRLSPPGRSRAVIATTSTRLYASGSSLASLPCAYTLELAGGSGERRLPGPEAQNQWKVAGDVLSGLGLPADAKALLQDISVTRRMSGENVESVVYRRTSAGDTATPGVLFLHGGPHHAVWDSFAAPLAALLALNVTIVLPNYRGSTGYGEAHTHALPGHAGEMDVKDCYEALQEVVVAGLIDPARVVVQGGSHGGFLTGHLIGQFPDAFKAAVMRNPVLNIPLMINVSDIPDWCQVETDGSSVALDGVPQFPPSLEQQRKMHDASPISHIDKVKTPVMMMLGSKDRRVPSVDGLSYAKALRCRGKKVEVHIFEEDAHPLDKPVTSFVSWLRIIEFFRIHLQ